MSRARRDAIAILLMSYPVRYVSAGRQTVHSRSPCEGRERAALSVLTDMSDILIFHASRSLLDRCRLLLRSRRQVHMTSDDFGCRCLYTLCSLMP
ncbi:hypothetical protein PSAC2689_70188 [Paraburkholderia sacchari]